MRFSGFDDGGWQLEVLGCQGAQKSLELARKGAENQLEQAGSAVAVEREKEEKESAVDRVVLC